jgi:hypothetical protein
MMKALTIAVVLALTPNLAAAAGYLLVLKYTGNNIVVAPRIYPTKVACNAAGRDWEEVSDFHEFVCIRAP